MTRCKRCGEDVVTDGWGKWVTRRFGWRTCGGDRLHEPVASASA